MPPKADVKTLIAKRHNSIFALKELFEEFESIYVVEPELDRLKSIFTLIETKYRGIKKQQEVIADRLVEDGGTETEELLSAAQSIGEKIKVDYIQVAKTYAAYQKKLSQSEVTSGGSETLEAMTSAVKKMAETMMSSKSKSSGLERLPVPTWDGRRRSYATWKKEFNHWMTKCSQDEDEQLQRFRKAMPKGLWWTDQVKTCKSITQAWKILDIEFEDRRKLMDELLAGINNQKQVKRDSKSLTRYATIITSYVNDMEDNNCSVTSSTEAPFFMSQLLSKLDPRDNAEFGREMRRMKREENATNLVDWLHEEACIRSRGKQESEEDVAERSSRGNYYKRSDNHAANYKAPSDEKFPLGCSTKHLLAACPNYQSSSVNERWEVVKKHQRCRKCLRSHHTKDCWKAEGTSCDKCKKDHHRSLHNEKKGSNEENVPSPSSLNPEVPPFTNPGNSTSKNNNAQTIATAGVEKKATTVAGLCPIQKILIFDVNGKPMEVLAMLDTGSDTSLLSKSTAAKLGLHGSQTHLTMNLAGGGKRSESSEVLDIVVASPVEESVKKTLQIHTVRKPCSNVQTISRKSVESYPHLKAIVDKLHLAGGAVDLLLGTDFPEAFVDVHTLSADSGEPIAKLNCFGWYLLGQLDSKSMNSSRIQSVNVGTMSMEECVNKLLQQDPKMASETIPPTPPPPPLLNNDNTNANGPTTSQVQSPDNAEPSTSTNGAKSWERAWTVDEMRKGATNWSLASDAGLLLYMQEFSQNMLSQTHSMEQKVDGLVHETKGISAKVHNTFNDFLMLSNTQFIENRVYDEEETKDEEEKHEETVAQEKEKTREELETEVIPKINEAIQCGLAVLDNAFVTVEITPEQVSDDEDEGTILENLKPDPILELTDVYAYRKLPSFIGSAEFQKDDLVGLGESSSEDEGSDKEASVESETEKSTEDEDSSETETVSGSPSESEEESSTATESEDEKEVVVKKKARKESSQAKSDDELFAAGGTVKSTKSKEAEADDSDESMEDDDEKEEQPRKVGVPMDFSSELAAKLGVKPKKPVDDGDEEADNEDDWGESERRESKSSKDDLFSASVDTAASVSSKGSRRKDKKHKKPKSRSGSHASHDSGTTAAVAAGNVSNELERHDEDDDDQDNLFTSSIDTTSSVVSKGGKSKHRHKNKASRSDSQVSNSSSKSEHKEKKAASNKNENNLFSGSPEGDLFDESSPFAKKGGMFSGGGGLFDDVMEDDDDDTPSKPETLGDDVSKTSHEQDESDEENVKQKPRTPSGKKLPAGAVAIFGDHGLFGHMPVRTNEHHVAKSSTPEDRVNTRHLLRSTENRVREFWNCWLKYFAPNLLPRNKWFRKRENVKIGDLVLELDPKLRRCQWKMAFVIDTYPGNDGLVRKVKIKTDVGEYDRPIHKLCLIATKEELNAEDE